MLQTNMPDGHVLHKDHEKQMEAMRLKMQALEADFSFVFNSPEGKRVLDYLFTQCHGGSSTWNNNTNQMFINEGKRQILIEIFKKLHKTGSESYNQMLHNQKLSEGFDF